MRERILSLLIVTLISMTIWLFAEAESLGSRSIATRVFVAQAQGLLVEVEGGDAGVTVEIDLSGSKRQLMNAQNVLRDGIRLEPGIGGMPDSDGRHELRLLDLIQAYPDLAETGVAVESVRPLTIPVTIRALATLTPPIIAELGELEAEGEVRITPPTGEVRIPQAAADSLRETLRLIARPTPEQIARNSSTSGLITINNVPVVLPEAVRRDHGAELIAPKSVSLTFTVRNRNRVARLQVPVQILLTSVDQPEWEVSIVEADAVIGVEFTGPAEEIAQIESPQDNFVIAVLALSSEDLEKGITSKEIGFGCIRQNVFGTLPPSLQIKPDRTAVRFTAVRRKHDSP